MCVCVYVWCVFINEGKGVKYNSIEFFYITVVVRQKLLLIQLNLSELYHKSTYSKLCYQINIFKALCYQSYSRLSSTNMNMQ